MLSALRRFVDVGRAEMLFVARKQSEKDCLPRWFWSRFAWPHVKANISWHYLISQNSLRTCDRSVT